MNQENQKHQISLGINLMEYRDNPVRILFKNDALWFSVKDACGSLGIENYRNIVTRLNDHEKEVHTVDTLGGKQKMTFMNEAALYKTIFTSRASKAEEFTDWVVYEVLPSIRKTGGYQLPKNHEVNEFMQKFNELEQQLQYEQQLNLQLASAAQGLDKSRMRRGLRETSQRYAQFQQEVVHLIENANMDEETKSNLLHQVEDLVLCLPAPPITKDLYQKDRQVIGEFREETKFFK